MAGEREQDLRKLKKEILEKAVGPIPYALPSDAVRIVKEADRLELPENVLKAMIADIPVNFGSEMVEVGEVHGMDVLERRDIIV